MLLDSSKLDKSVPIPLYFQLKELILSEIKNGNYPSGSLIPTENELSEAFEISRTTVRQAITELVQEGWLYRVKSKGTFVSQPKVTQDFVTKLESFNKQMARLGIKASTEVIEFKTLKAPEPVAEALHINEKEMVILLHRKRFADGEPIVTVKTFLPYVSCSCLLDHDFTKESLYELLGQSETTRISRIQRRIEAVEATSEDVAHLNIKRGKPIQFFTSIGYNIYDQPLEYSLARYRGDRNSFEITVVPE